MLLTSDQSLFDNAGQFYLNDNEIFYIIYFENIFCEGVLN